MTRTVYLVDGARTPFLKAKNEPGAFTASDLGVYAARELLNRFQVAEAIDEVIVGCVMPSASEANIARLIGLRLGLPLSVPAWTVQRNCASGLQAIDAAMSQIRLGKSELILCGGTEAMSHAPLLFPPTFSAFLGRLRGARSISEKIKCMVSFKFSLIKPVIALLEGLTDPVVRLNMGQTAEILADEWQITREEMDQFAYNSQQRSARERATLQEEMVPIYDAKGTLYFHDDGVRENLLLSKLSELKPVFDKPYGTVTAGNSSQITDGACMLLLASQEAVEKYNLPILAELKNCAWSGLDPKVMGLGPAYAISKLLQENKLAIEDINRFEINEAFAVQVLACIKALEHHEFCKTFLHLKRAVGAISLEKLNQEGGGIACGHPVGASGARITLHLARMLKKNNEKQGVASLCIGGGQGGAILVENILGA